MTGQVRPQDIQPGKSGGKMSGMQKVLDKKYGHEMFSRKMSRRGLDAFRSDRNKIIFVRIFRIRTSCVHHTLYQVKKDAPKGDLPMFWWRLRKTLVPKNEMTVKHDHFTLQQWPSLTKTY